MHHFEIGKFSQYIQRIGERLLFASSFAIYSYDIGTFGDASQTFPKSTSIQRTRKSYLNFDSYFFGNLRINHSIRSLVIDQEGVKAFIVKDKIPRPT